MEKAIKIYLVFLFAAFFQINSDAQVCRHDLRAGNRDFRKGDLREAEMDYRRAVVKDSLSMAAQYNLANALYCQEDYEGASKAYEAIGRSGMSDAASAKVSKSVSKTEGRRTVLSDSRFNAGDAALQKKDYAAAVKSFKESLLINPDDIEAKENYIYARKMLEDQQNNQDQNQQQQDQDDRQDNQDQNKDQDQDQDRNQDQQDRNQDSQPQPQESDISPQQAQQMLQAIQAKEKETQDKVNKEKAAAMQARQKDKYW